jgi:DNA processing protein
VTRAWAQAVAAGGDAERVARVLRLAVAGWTSPGRVERAALGLLERGRPHDADGVLAALERAAGALPAWPDVVPLATRLAELRAAVLVVGDSGYPRSLADAWPELGAPLALFIRAPAARLPAGPAAAIVGTRRPSLDGLETAAALARICARAGVTVVSGMARGIDQAAHRAAVDLGGATVAVLGTGLDVDYPRGDAALRDAVADAGALVTELRLGAPPRPAHFLARNRILAGLADVTVVVEGRARSGALQTARLAAQQGREVLAVPGSLRSPTARGPLDLIRDGVQPLTRLEDVLDAVGHPRLPLERDTPPPAAGVSAVAGELLPLLGTVPALPGALAAATGQPVAAVLAAVAELATRGLAVATPRGVVAATARS